MKINPVIAIIAMLFVALLFCVYTCCNADMLLSITASASAALLLVSAMAVRFDTGRNHTFLFRTVSAVLLVVSLAMNGAFACFDALSTPVVIVPNIILVLIWLLCLNGALKREKTNNESR
ncbi:MAG: hypothetical protein ACI35T_04695 [Alistipes sp.]